MQLAEWGQIRAEHRVTVCKGNRVIQLPSTAEMSESWKAKAAKIIITTFLRWEA